MRSQLPEFKIDTPMPKCKPPPPKPPPLRVECGYCHYVFSKGDEFDNHKCCAEVRIFRFIRGLFK
jgi:hypothetical protein